MGDRANIYMELPVTREQKQGVYLYTHWSGCEWPEELRQALEFGRDRWGDDQYLARILVSRIFRHNVDDTTGGGLSLMLCDNEYPIIVADLVTQTVSFAREGAEHDPEQRYGHMSFATYVAQAEAKYPA